LKYGDPAELEAKIERDASIIFQQKKSKIVDSFTGYFDFLSLEHPCVVFYQSHKYNSAAHAYAAAKVLMTQESAPKSEFNFDSLLRRI